MVNSVDHAAATAWSTRAKLLGGHRLAGGNAALE
jgi:hypothetical protein